MISIICVYNNGDLFANNLKRSLELQDSAYELIAIDNTSAKYHSARSALNYGGRQAKGNYLMFVHQDVVLPKPSWLRDMEDILDKIPDLGIAGCAGIDKDGIVGFIQDSHGLWGRPLAGPTPVQTIDECISIIPKKIFDLYNFDEDTTGWHAYAVDYCLAIKRKGLNAYVIPNFIWHNSPATNRKGLIKAHDYIWAKHFRYYRNIYTTCGHLCWKNMLISLAIRTIEKLSKYRFKIYYRESDFPSFERFVSNEFRDAKKILYLEHISENATEYYKEHMVLKTTSLPGYQTTKDKMITTYLTSRLTTSNPDIGKEQYEGAIISMDVLQNITSETWQLFINKIAAIGLNKILIFKVLDDKHDEEGKIKHIIDSFRSKKLSENMQLVYDELTSQRKKVIYALKTL